MEESFRESLHRDLLKSLQRAAQMARGQGATDDEIRGLVTEAAEAGARAAGETIADRLAGDAPAMHADHRAMWQAIRAEVRSVWGGAIDAFYEVVVCVDETAEQFVKDNVRDAAEADNLRFKVLVDLLGQAVRTATEVRTLLENGMPTGAEARARSLHEMNAVTRVLADHGHDLTRRFLDYEDVIQWRYVCEHDHHAGELRREPFGKEIRESLQQAVDGHTAEYGKDFKKPYGWSSHLWPPGVSGFRAIENLAGLKHWRADYIVSSQSVHPTAWSASLNIEGSSIVTSWRLTGFAEPANAALVSLYQIATTVLMRTFPGESNTADQVSVAAVDVLLERAQTAFIAAEEVAAARLNDETSNGPLAGN